MLCLPSRRRALVAIAAFAAFACPANVRAEEDRPVRFALELAESPLDECGGTKAVEDAVEERLRRATFEAAAVADITVAVTPETSNAPKVWRALIVERDASGTELGRRDVPLPTDDCRKAVDTLAVVLAIMIGPARTTTDPPRGPAEPAPIAPHIPPTPAVRVEPARPRPPRVEPLRWTASPLIGLAAGTGVLPGLSWGIEAGAIVRPPVRHLSMIVRLGYWPEQETPTLPPAKIDRISGAVLGCWELFRADDFRGVGCGGVDVSRVEATSSQLTRASDRSTTFAALGEVRFGYRFSFEDKVFVEPFFAPQMSVFLLRDRFTYKDPMGRERTLLFPAPVAVQASFGVAVHFL
jgi:hypothetical protein